MLDSLPFSVALHLLGGLSPDDLTRALPRVSRSVRRLAAVALERAEKLELTEPELLAEHRVAAYARGTRRLRVLRAESLSSTSLSAGTVYHLADLIRRNAATLEVLALEDSFLARVGSRALCGVAFPALRRLRAAWTALSVPLAPERGPTAFAQRAGELSLVAASNQLVDLEVSELDGSPGWPPALRRLALHTVPRPAPLTSLLRGWAASLRSLSVPLGEWHISELVTFYTALADTLPHLEELRNTSWCEHWYDRVAWDLQCRQRSARRLPARLVALEVPLHHLQLLELPGRLQELITTTGKNTLRTRSDTRRFSGLPERAPHLAALCLIAHPRRALCVRPALLCRWRELLHREQHWSSLRRLELTVRACPVSEVIGFARQLPALREAALEFGLLDEPRDLALLLARLPHLERAHLTHSGTGRDHASMGVTARGVASVAVTSELRSLAVNATGACSPDEGAQVLVEVFRGVFLPQLEALSAWGVVEHRVDLPRIRREAPRLRTVHLYGPESPAAHPALLEARAQWSPGRYRVARWVSLPSLPGDKSAFS